MDFPQPACIPEEATETGEWSLIGELLSLVQVLLDDCFLILLSIKEKGGGRAYVYVVNDILSVKWERIHRRCTYEMDY